MALIYIVEDDVSVISILEDIGFFCVDNLPGKMLSKLIELCQLSADKGGEIPRVAVGIDVRSVDYWRGALKVLRDEVEEFLRLTETK